MEPAWTLPSERAGLGVESRMLRSTVAEFADLIQVTPSTGYGILARVRFEPTCAAGEQLVDLGLADPVALAVFGDGEEHVEVVQQLGERVRRGSRNVAEGGTLLLRVGRGLDLVA